MTREVVVVGAVRTAIGDYGGALKDFTATELAARVVREAVSRAAIEPPEVGHCVFGHGYMESRRISTCRAWRRCGAG